MISRAERVSGQMYDLADQAWRGIDRVIMALEANEGYADNLALQLKRRRLIEDERDRRIPFLRGIGAYLAASLMGEDSNERTKQHRQTRPIHPSIPCRLRCSVSPRRDWLCVTHPPIPHNGRRRWMAYYVREIN